MKILFKLLFGILLFKNRYCYFSFVDDARKYYINNFIDDVLNGYYNEVQIDEQFQKVEIFFFEEIEMQEYIDKIVDYQKENPENKELIHLYTLMSTKLDEIREDNEKVEINEDNDIELTNDAVVQDSVKMNINIEDTKDADVQDDTKIDIEYAKEEVIQDGKEKFIEASDNSMLYIIIFIKKGSMLRIYG